MIGDQTDALDLATFTSNPAQPIAKQDLINLINAPSLKLTGRPVIGNGANGAPGTGQNWRARRVAAGQRRRRRLRCARPKRR